MRDLRERFGPWSTVYQRFCDWRDDGTFDRILERLHIRLNREVLIDLDTWMIDSTAVRATRASPGAGAALLPRFTWSATPMGCHCASSFRLGKPAISPTPSRCWIRCEFPVSRGDHASVVAGYWLTKAMTQNTCVITETVTECSR